MTVGIYLQSEESPAAYRESKAKHWCLIQWYSSLAPQSEWLNLFHIVFSVLRGEPWLVMQLHVSTAFFSLTLEYNTVIYYR